MNISGVLIITENSLLNVSLTNLINTSGSGLFVVESTAQEFDELNREINKHKVNVILLDKANSFADEEVLTNLLTMYPKFLIVIVDEESNWLQIYRREKILLTSTKDLLSTINSI
jgi:hypothetical protein